MKASRVLLSGIAALSMTMAAMPASAKARPGAAQKLSLAGAQGASGCVSRPGMDGDWRQDASGNWARCNNAAGGGDDGGGGLGIGYIIAGVAAVAGIVVAVVSGGDDTPSSP